MERRDISAHEVKSFIALKDASDWLTSRDVAKRAGISHRTARDHLHRFVKLGIADQAMVSPGWRYQLSAHAHCRNTAYLQRLEAARVILRL